MVNQTRDQDVKSKKTHRLGPFLLLKTLGVGEFSKVKMGKHIETDQKVAVKLVKKEGMGASVQLEKIRQEIEILKTLNHPYIVKLLTVKETTSYIGIVLEYAEGGELFEYIYKQKWLQEEEACRLFSQLISCVDYMHQKNIAHRDLKLENILLDGQGNLIVTDFGFANHFLPKSGDLMSTSCGSPCYAAPELVMTGHRYSARATDIWSSGVILYAMLCGYLPFDDDTKNPNDNIGRLYRYIMENAPKFPERLSFESKDLISGMLVPDPDRRWSLKVIMAHPWLQPHRALFDKPLEAFEHETWLVKQTLTEGTLSDKSDYHLSNASTDSSLPSAQAQCDALPELKATQKKTEPKKGREKKENDPVSPSTSLRAKFFSSVRGPRKQRKSVIPVQPSHSKSTGWMTWIKNKTHKHDRPNSTPIPLLEPVVCTPHRPSSSLIPTHSIDAEASAPMRIHPGTDLPMSVTKSSIETLLDITRLLILFGIQTETQGLYRLLCRRQGLQAIYGHPDLDNGEPLEFTFELCRSEDTKTYYGLIEPSKISKNEDAFRFIKQKVSSVLRMKHLVSE
ncbi:kinase-like domain-containing protein [Sporodiniella umbellata]|nr:kinase-like domain-containing protein [Sporodiniella umbellata]